MAADSTKTFKITKIEAQKHPGRYNVYVNDHYAFPVGEDVMVRYRLLKGTELTPALIATLKTADAQSKAWSMALNYLSYQQRTEKELRDYLAQKEVAPEVVAPVMARLLDQRLLDDAQYAHSYVRTMKRTSDKGPTVIKRQLKQKAVAENLIEDALNDDYSVSEQLDRLSELVEKQKKHYQRLMPSIQRQKVQQRLIEKGFSFDLVSTAMAETDFELPQSQAEDLLSKQAEKAWRKYRTKDPYERSLKVRQALYRKGFTSDAINRWLDQHRA